MREQVIVLPPFIERSFRLSKQEEALLSTNKESRIWAASERENAENITGFFLMERDPQHTILAELASTEKVKMEDALGEHSAEDACKEQKQHGTRGEGSLAGERIPSNGDGGQVLQWGLRRRSRFSRADTLKAGSRVDNHNIKPAGRRLANDSSVLYRKTVRIQADRASATQPNVNPLAAKGTLKTKNGVAAKRELLLSEETQKQQAKVLKRGTSDVKQGANGLPVRGKRGNSSPNHKQDHLHRQSKPCTLANTNSASLDRCAVPLPNGNDDGSVSKNELVWPKLIIALSRKEKEEDFLMFKGSKLPQRPKRRPKAAEKALCYCSPGSWLVDLSISRYDVREKKRCRKRRRGLKAMESLDSDSD